MNHGQTKLFVAAFLMSCFGYVEAMFNHFAQPTNITNYSLIRKGMTKDQLGRLMGSASDDKRFLIPLAGFLFPPPYDFEKPPNKEWLTATWSNWKGGNGTLVVLFDADGKVNGKAFIYAEYYLDIVEFLRGRPGADKQKK